MDVEGLCEQILVVVALKRFALDEGSLRARVNRLCRRKCFESSTWARCEATRLRRMGLSPAWENRTTPGCVVCGVLTVTGRRRVFEAARPGENEACRSYLYRSRCPWFTADVF